MVRCVSLVLLVHLLTAGCKQETAGEAPGDKGGGTDASVQGSDAEGPSSPSSCDPNAACCFDIDCSDLIFCNGVERCVNGVCRAGEPPLCDDGKACTKDVCDERAKGCHFQPQDEACNNGNFCDGLERCSPAARGADEEGCVPGRPPVCDDNDDCTEDFCADNQCQRRLRDHDGDGHGDRTCQICEGNDCLRGDDCDDNDPDVFPAQEEICADGKDNNCDHHSDYADPSCLIPNDSCSEALELEPGVVVYSSTRAAGANIDDGCGPANGPDVAFVFALSEESDVEIKIDARSRQPVSLSLSSACGRKLSTIVCESQSEEPLRRRALAPGTYSVVATTSAEADFSIKLRVTAAEPLPEGDACDGAPSLTGDGAPLALSLADKAYDYPLSCVSDQRLFDAVYTLKVPTEQSLNLVASGDDVGKTVAIALQQVCGLKTTELGCWAQAGRVEGRVAYVMPGTYAIVVGHESASELEFSATLSELNADSFLAEDFSSSVPYGWKLSGAFGQGIPSGSGGEPGPRNGGCLATTPGGAYPPGMTFANDFAQTPLIELWGARNPVLSFWSWLDTQESDEGAHLEVSIDDGATWEALAGADLNPPYNATTNPSYDGTPRATGVWRGNRASWAQYSVSLEAYVDQAILIRFAMYSYRYGSPSRPGWYIDDVVVED